MAQQGNNGGGNNPVLPFGYDPNYLQPRQSSSSEPPRQQNLHHHHQQQQYNQSAQAVLNDSDDAFIQSFFQNPDGANSTEDIHNVAWSLDQKPPEHPNFGSWDFNAAQNTALTNRSQGSFQPQAQQHGQQPQHMDGFYQQQMTGAASDADMLSGASSLFNLSNQQQQQQDASGGTGFGGASWGNFAAGVGHVLAGPENLQSPLTSSGRQSSGGSLYTPTSGSLSQQQLGQHLQFQQMMRDQQHGQGRHQSQPQNVHQQPQPQPQHHVPHQGQHTRHPSLQLDTAHTGMFQMFQQNQGNASWLAQQALQFTPQQNQGAQRPSMLRFESQQSDGCPPGRPGRCRQPQPFHAATDARLPPSVPVRHPRFWK
ncbi:hypothetical protein K431DRAFT_163384 [Polychaeton citri CBS 116435]|uniref:Uncharacterized protein n=1 Tax=Polychaeton citri CBS 116435 TaxID=1314669 RepID=A0A9P4UTD2_9PEZI|nr:hypothetical protein K431DRAFT_163384 [Polychaeton citri CBS 116435]